jgi:hypothetical protein
MTRDQVIDAFDLAHEVSQAEWLVWRRRGVLEASPDFELSMSVYKLLNLDGEAVLKALEMRLKAAQDALARLPKTEVLD